MGKTKWWSMTHSSPSRGLLYTTPPDYDVFKGPRSNTPEADELESEDDSSGSATTEASTTDSPASGTPEPVMARANWTGNVPADD